MAIARAIPATPQFGAALLLTVPLFLLSAHPAHAAAPIEFASSADTPMQLAELTPDRESKDERAPARHSTIISYDYGAYKAPPSGPTIDLRGAFGAPPPASHDADPGADSAATAPPPAPARDSGPIDIRPPAPAPAATAPANPPPAPSRAPTKMAAAGPMLDGGQQAGAYMVQIGAFAVQTNAERVRARAATVGAVLVDTIERGNSLLYRVRVGPWLTRDAADAARASVADLGYADAKVTQAD